MSLVIGVTTCGTLFKSASAPSPLIELQAASEVCVFEESGQETKVWVWKQAKRVEIDADSPDAAYYKNRKPPWTRAELICQSKE